MSTTKKYSFTDTMSFDGITTIEELEQRFQGAKDSLKKHQELVLSAYIAHVNGVEVSWDKSITYSK